MPPNPDPSLRPKSQPDGGEPGPSAPMPVPGGHCRLRPPNAMGAVLAVCSIAPAARGQAYGCGCCCCAASPGWSSSWPCGCGLSLPMPGLRWAGACSPGTVSRIDSRPAGVTMQWKRGEGHAHAAQKQTVTYTCSTLAEHCTASNQGAAVLPCTPLLPRLDSLL